MQPMPQIKEMPVETLKAKLDKGEKPLILDVREDWERRIAQISGSVHIPMNAIPERLNELDRNAEIVVQ